MTRNYDENTEAKRAETPNLLWYSSLGDQTAQRVLHLENYFRLHYLGKLPGYKTVPNAALYHQSQSVWVDKTGPEPEKSSKPSSLGIFFYSPLNSNRTKFFPGYLEELALQKLQEVWQKFSKTTFSVAKNHVFQHTWVPLPAERRERHLSPRLFLSTLFRLQDRAMSHWGQDFTQKNLKAIAF